MSLDGYVLGWKAPVPKQRYFDYRAGLLDLGECAVFYQDLIEAECVPAALLQHAVHYVEMGLCRIPDQMPLN